jgi:hypothetical protein
MESEGRKIVAGTDATIPLRDSDNSQIVTSASSKHEFATLNSEVFHGANAAGTAVTTQAGLSVTTPALTLYNPVNSGVNLVLLRVNVSVHAAPAAASDLMLVYNSTTATAPATTTDATMVSGMIGSTTAPAGRCYRIATLGAVPTAFRYLGSVIAATSTNQFIIDHDVNGDVVIPPGGCISIQATTAISILASFTWKELTV